MQNFHPTIIVATLTLCMPALAELPTTSSSPTRVDVVETKAKPAAVPFLRGVNLLGNQRYLGAKTWPTQQGLQALQDKGMNAFRIATSWENMQPVLMGPLDSVNVAGLIATVNQITNANGLAIIDFSNSMRRKQTDADPGLIVGESAVTAAMLGDAWTKVAAIFRSNPKVIFNLSNEPHSQDTTKLAGSYTTIIGAIRATGATNAILLDGNNYSDPATWVSSGNGAAMLSVVDPLNNLIFSPHIYFDKAGGTKTQCVAGVAMDPLNLGAPTVWARANGKRLFLGEFGGSTSAGCLGEMTDALTFVEANADVWVGWSNFAAYAGQAPFNDPDDFFYALDSAANSFLAGKNRLDPRLELLTTFMMPKVEFKMTDLGRTKLRGWYKPSDGRGASWLDSSGNVGRDFFQNDAKRQPSLATSGGLAFTSGRYLDAPGIAAGTAATTEIVFAVVSVPSSGGELELLQSSSSGTGRQIRIQANGYVVANDQGRYQLFGTASSIELGRKQLIVIAGGATGKAISGSLNAKPEVSGWGDSTFSGNASSRMGPFSGSAQPAVIHEMVITSTSITAGEKAKVIGRLMWDHALQDIAPANFPFKVKAPFTLGTSVTQRTFAY